MINLQSLKLTFIAGILGPGGAERQLFYILKTLKNCGADLSLVTLSSGQYWEKPIQELGVPIWSFSVSTNKFSKLNSIVSLTRSFQPLLIQSQHFYTNLYSSFTGRWLHIPDIGAIRSNGAYEVKQTGHIFGWLSLFFPAYLAANSKAGRNFAENHGVPAYRLRFLPNVVDTQLFTPKSDNRLSGSVTLLLISNLHFREKRVDLFIEAVSRLLKMSHIPMVAKIVGDGPLRAELESTALHEGIASEQIQFLGNLSTVQDAYKQADILVLTSDREGTPNVIMEAMASGLPVVATAVGGVADLVQDGQTGFLVPAGDLDGLVEKLSVLVDNEGLRRRMGAAGRDYILSHHSLERLPGILTEFYASIL